MREISLLKTILLKRSYLLAAVALIFLFMFVYIAVPVFTIRGNDLAFQLSTYNVVDWLVLLSLSVSSSFLVVVSWYANRHRPHVCGVHMAGSASASGALAGVMASLIATASCAGCIAPLIALFGLGFGTVTFILQYQLYFAAFAIVVQFSLLFFLLYRSVRTR